MPSIDSHSRLVPPEYLVQAIHSFGQSSKGCAVATIALAMAATDYCREIASGRCGKVSPNTTPKKLVTRLLSGMLKDGSLASRLFDVNDLVERCEKLNLKLDGVGSQGVLFAMVAAAKNASDNQLTVMVDDAAVMRIRAFGTKWNPPRKSKRHNGTPDLPEVLEWLRSAHPDDVRITLKACQKRLDACHGQKELQGIACHEPAHSLPGGIDPKIRRRVCELTKGGNT